MAQSPPTPDSDEERDSQLVDHRGRPLPQRVNWRKRLGAISTRTKYIAKIIAATVVGASAVVAGLFQIIDHITPDPAPPSVPGIAVKLSNSSQEEIDVLARGDFYLWLPGPGAQHAVGKYEFRTADGNAPDNYQIKVRPGATVTVYARILNQEQYGRLLEQNEYDITLQVRRANGELGTTEDLPFTRAAIGKYYLAVDVGTM